MSRAYAATMFAALAVMWGLSFPAISVGLEYLPPLLFAAFRYDVAAVLLLGYAVATTDTWRPVGWNNVSAILGGGAFLIAGNGLLFIGQQTVPSGVAAILQALVPILTALWALALLGERLSAVGAVGAGLGFLGVGLIVQPDPNNLLAGDTVGRLIIVGQVVLVSLGGVIVQRAGPTMERVALTGWSMLVGGLLLHAFSLGAGELPGASALSSTAVGAVVYLGVFSTALAFLIYFTFLEERGAFETSLVAYLVPVVATVAGVFLLDETIGLLSVAGFVVVFVGFALLKRHALVDLVGAGVS
ncbi:DMT family transporter [Natronomonas salina]|uniref:DMT family transporter n=1 Tax=Natronomonas salina TaxID=1710540 RepID=UPI001FEB6637|nr:EamA family transporter [Natronomonas salina]